MIPGLILFWANLCRSAIQKMFKVHRKNKFGFTHDSKIFYLSLEEYISKNQNLRLQLYNLETQYYLVKGLDAWINLVSWESAYEIKTRNIILKFEDKIYPITIARTAHA